MTSSSISAHIFRAYDIRGHAETELTNHTVNAIGHAFAEQCRNAGSSVIYLARDGRLSSDRIATVMARALVASGCRVIDLGRVHTGQLYFACHHSFAGHPFFKDRSLPQSRCGVMVTASHNPADDNGLKLVIDGLPISPDAIQKLYQSSCQFVTTPFIDREITPDSLVPFDSTTEYCERIASDISINTTAKKLKVVIDAGNGVAGPAAQCLFSNFDIELISLYCDVDGHFPNHHPDPSLEENIADLRREVVLQHADIGLAFDGDGDRVVLVDHHGEVVSPDHCLMLLLEDIVPKSPGRAAVYDVKSCRHIPLLIQQLGGQPCLWKTGHSLMKQKVKDSGAAVGGEYSGHYYIQDRWYGFDDGLYVAARVLEILSLNNKSLAEKIAEYPRDIATPEMTIAIDEHVKFQLIEKLADDQELKSDGMMSLVDGVRVDFPYGWGLVRASNTSAKLTLRFAAESSEKLNTIKNKFISIIKKYNPALEII